MKLTEVKMKNVLIIVILSMTMFVSCSSMKDVYLENDRYIISLEDVGWELSFPKNDFVVRDYTLYNDNGYAMFADASNNLVIAITIDKLEKYKDAIACREDFVNNPLASPFLFLTKRFLRYEIGEASCLEYYVAKYEGKEINVNTITAVYAKGMSAIKIHVSKTDFQKENREKMLEIVSSMLFNEK